MADSVDHGPVQLWQPLHGGAGLELALFNNPFANPLPFPSLPGFARFGLGQGGGGAAAALGQGPGAKAIAACVGRAYAHLGSKVYTGAVAAAAGGLALIERALPDLSRAKLLQRGAEELRGIAMKGVEQGSSSETHTRERVQLSPALARDRGRDRRVGQP